MIRIFNRRDLPGGSALGGALGAVFLGAVDLTVISTVLPKIVADLQINTADIDRYIWVVNAYLLAYIVAIPVVGRVSDLLGRRIAFQGALALFLLGSIGSALSSNLTELIAARALQGAGGGALLPVTMALVGDFLPEGRRASTLGLVGAVDTLGWVLGPIWGAIVVGALGGVHDSWRWVFWINVPLGLAVAVIIHFKTRDLEKHACKASRGRLDIGGTILLGSSLLLLNLGLSSGGEAGIHTGSAFRALGGTKNPLSTYLPWFLFAGGVLLVAFIFWERRASSPLLPVSLFQSRIFVAALMANFFAGAALIAAMVDVPITVALLADPSHVSSISALLLAPFTLLMAATSLAGGEIAERYGARATALMGVSLVVVGYIALWLGLREQEYLDMIPGLALAGAGFGMVVAPIGASAIDQANDEQRGAAAATTILFRLLGMTIGISALTSFGIRRLQSLSNDVAPVVRQPGESTADFFLRQNQFIQDVAIPMTLRVIQETFLVAAVFACLAAFPLMYLRRDVESPASKKAAVTEN